MVLFNCENSEGNCRGAGRYGDSGDNNIGDRGGDIGKGGNNAGEERIDRDYEMKGRHKYCFILAMQYEVWGHNLSKTEKIHKMKD